MRIWGISCMLMLACCMFGCASFVIHAHPSPRSGFCAVPEMYRMPRTMPVMKFEAPVSILRYSMTAFSFSSQFHSGFSRNDKIDGVAYLPKNPVTSDVFIILPGSGENVSARLLAETLALDGHIAVQIHPGFKPLPRAILTRAMAAATPQKMLDVAGGFYVEAMRTHVIDLMRLEDFLAAWPKIPYPRAFHVVGISLGGIYGSLLANVDHERVHSRLMIVSAGSVARILMDTGNPDIARMRNILMGKFGLGYDEAYRLIAQKLAPAEPLTYAACVDPARMLMVSGNLDMMGIPVDSAIPYSATHETWEAYGKPEWIQLLFTGHASSFLAFAPLWIELPYFWHWPMTLTQPYVTHVIRNHYLPKALH